MNCERADELLEEFVLGSLSLEEEGGIRSHITDCRKHDQALTELQAVVDRLPLASPEREPPSSVRSGLLEKFEREAGQPAGTPSSIGVRQPAFLRSAFWPAAVAALLLMAIGLGAWTLVLSGGDDSEGVRTVFVGTLGQGNLIYIEDEQIVVLDLALPALGSDRVYQAWGLFDDRVDSLGLAANQGITAVRHDLTGADGVAISIEPPGGSAQPTSDPILLASLG